MRIHIHDPNSERFWLIFLFRKELRSMEDRDVSEQIALGVPAKKTGDGLFDQRLFGENKGMDSGFDRK